MTIKTHVLDEVTQTLYILVLQLGHHQPKLRTPLDLFTYHNQTLEYKKLGI